MEMVDGDGEVDVARGGGGDTSALRSPQKRVAWVWPVAGRESAAIGWLGGGALARVGRGAALSLSLSRARALSLCVRVTRVRVTVDRESESEMVGACARGLVGGPWVVWSGGWSRRRRLNFCVQTTTRLSVRLGGFL